MHLCLMTLVSGTLFLSTCGSDTDCALRTFTYRRSCRDDSNFVSQTHESSVFACTHNCVRNDMCVGFTTCLRWDGRFLCQLFNYAGNGICAKSRPECKYMESDSVVYESCQNGGTQSDTTCVCSPGWAGKYCERRYRDCYDAKVYGAVTTGRVTILPTTSTAPLEVYCSYGATFILRRGRDQPESCTTQFDPSENMKYFKRSYGDPESRCDYFIGLDKLHAILLQGNYIVHTYVQYHYPNMTEPVSLQAEYYDFKIQDESSDFALDHGAYEDLADPDQNPDNRKGKQLFQNGRPRRFCTPEGANCDCAKEKGVSWWYGSDCSSEFPLTALPLNGLMMSVDGFMTELSLALMTFYPPID